MTPASRVAGEGLSPIRRMSLGAGADVVNLGLGEPGWPLPTPARETLARVAQEEGALPYGPNTGDPGLVSAISEGAGVSTDQVMVTSGSQAALFALFQAHVDPGTTVLVPNPGFLAYATLARLCGAAPVGYPLGPDGDLDAEALVQSLGEERHTCVVVVNHPANPTGGGASAEALAQVASACADRGVLLVSDEVYAELWLDEPPASLHDVTGPEGGVVLGSVSKAYGAPGLRVGWAIGPEQVLAPARLVHNAMTTAPARPSQAAALALVEAGETVLTQAREHLRVRWELAAQVAPEVVSLGSGRAGLYLWLPVPERIQESTEDYAMRLRDEARVTTIPGTAFGSRGEGYLRVSVGGPVDQLEEGLRRLAPWWKA